MLQMPGSGWWYSRPHRKDYDPSGVDIFLWFPRSCVKAINLRGIQLIYNDKKSDLGGYGGCFCHNFLMQKQ